MKARLTCVLVAAGLLLAGGFAWAHHSFAAEFDSTKPVTLTGKVTKVEWMNPHAHFLVEVKDENGKPCIWDFELGSPNALMRQGWDRNSLKPGDVVTVDAYRAKDGTNLANARLVTLSDGRKVFAGSSQDGGPTR